MDEVEIKAENAAKSICHDLHEGYVPGCGRCLSLMDTEAARSFIKESILQEFREPVEVSIAGEVGQAFSYHPLN